MRSMASSAYTESRRARTARKYRTQCKTCRLAIYEDQPAEWSSGENKPTGLVHTECAS